MTVSEIDTFYFKFKNLLLAEKNATLTLRSEDGRAQVTLSVDLGHLLPGAVPQHQQPHQCRNSPARIRRRERRAEARRNAEAEEALETSKEMKKSMATQTTEIVDIGNNQETDTRDTTEDAVVNATEKVADEFCSDQEYSGPFRDVESEDTITYEIECWDPGNKWIEQDVFNHMGESLEQMFICFKVKSEDQQYRLDVLEKVKDTFPLKLEMKKFKGNEAVIDNFRRQGHVPGGGCVKFFRKLV